MQRFSAIAILGDAKDFIVFEKFYCIFLTGWGRLGNIYRHLTHEQESSPELSPETTQTPYFSGNLALPLSFPNFPKFAQIPPNPLKFPKITHPELSLVYGPDIPQPPLLQGIFQRKSSQSDRHVSTSPAIIQSETCRSSRTTS